MMNLMMDFSKSKTDLVGRYWIWYSISLAVIVLGLIGMIRNTITDGFPLVRGIDFTGGSIIQLQFDNWDQTKDVSQFAQDVKVLVSNYSEKSPEVQTTLLAADKSGTGNPALIIQIRADSTLLQNTAKSESLFGEIRSTGGDFRILEETEVGPLMGKELTSKAIQGVAIGMLLILIYITFRLSLDFAVCAVIGLLHDILVVTGVYALFRLEVNSSFVAVLLTVVGYSINDTIIIYDRIRENMKVKKHLPFDKLVNVSLLETMARSINTSLTTVLAILALLIFGGLSLRTFMLGLAVGITTGTYSSIFNSSCLLVNWRMRKGTAVITREDAGRAAARLIHDEDDDDEMIDLSDDNGEAVEQISVTQGPKTSDAKRLRPKRRKRRH
ncbi:MAG: protein translocase subunit SecF [bacterium]|nr:protein translocase subunit SecF [bacterium]